MNIRLPVPFKQAIEAYTEKDQRQLTAPKTGPRAGKPLTEGQWNRKLRRVRHADAIATARRSRRSAFKQELERFHAEHDLRGIARVHLLGHGNASMRLNAERHITAMASALVKAGGKNPRKDAAAVEEARMAIVDQLRQMLIAWGEL